MSPSGGEEEGLTFFRAGSVGASEEEEAEAEAGESMRSGRGAGSALSSYGVDSGDGGVLVLARAGAEGGVPEEEEEEEVIRGWLNQSGVFLSLFSLSLSN